MAAMVTCQHTVPEVAPHRRRTKTRSGTAINLLNLVLLVILVIVTWLKPRRDVFLKPVSDFSSYVERPNSNLGYGAVDNLGRLDSGLCFNSFWCLHPTLRSQRTPYPPDRSTRVMANLLLAIIQQAGDLELNPGLVKFPCGECAKPVRWNQRAVQCDGCDKWIHIKCMGMGPEVYTGLQTESASWICCGCGMPNFSSTFFRSLTEEHSMNTFSTLNSSICDDNGPPGQPLYTSSPSNPPPKKKTAYPPLKIVNINFRSAVNKPGELENLVKTVDRDIILASESWLKPHISDSEVFPSDTYQSNFSLYRKDRPDVKGGGVFVAVSERFVSDRDYELDSNGENIWVKIDIHGRKTLRVGAFYRPDVGHAESIEELDDILHKVQNSTSDVFYGGDFNLPGWDWETRTLKEKCQYPDLHQRFGDILDDTALTQVVTEPTRGENTLDLMITNNPSIITKTQVIPGISDHDIPLLEVDLNPVKLKQKPRNIPLYKKANWEALDEHMQNTRRTMTEKADTSSVNELWIMFRDGLQEGINKFIPHKRAKNTDGLPWLSLDTKKLMKKRDRLHAKLKKGKDQNRQERYRDLRRRIQQNIRRDYWKYVEGIFTPEEEGQQQGCLKKFWTYIKHRKKGKTSVAPLKEGYTLHSNPREKAEILNRQFSSVFSSKQPLTLAQLAHEKTQYDARDQTCPVMPDINISRQGVEKLLANLNPHKAAGPDAMKPLVMKKLASALAGPLTLIFTRSMEDGEIPEDWSRANVSPIYKKGEKSNPANYRPVSLTCIACKLMEHIVTSQLMQHANRHNLLYDLQYGFREKRSCETQLLGFVDDLMNNMRGKSQTDVIIMDFAKAFDKVEHNRLCHKLLRHGVQGKTNQWIKAFLSNRTQRVVVENETSTEAPVSSGVPQGSVLGPCLFLFYINDLPVGLQAKTRLFADDTLIYITVSSDSSNALQEDLHKLEKWEQDWFMKFHPQKCEVLSVTRSQSVVTRDYTLHGHILNRVSSAKYLGVTINHQLKWNEHINNISSKANSTLGFLRRNLQIGSREIKTRAYQTLVRPTLEYSCTVWDPHEQTLVNRLEMVQRRAARYVTGIHSRRASVTQMLQEMGWTSLEERRSNQRLAMLFKIVNGLVAIRPEDHMLPASRITRRMNTQSFNIPSSPSNYHKFSFFPRTIRQWNLLPEATVSSPCIDTFKAGLQEVPT
jgi:hypothetical protein